MLGVITSCILVAIIILIVHACITVPTALLVVGFVAALLAAGGLIFVFYTKCIKKSKGS